jgi:transmembrane sensor
MHRKLTVEELLLDESFIDFCHHPHSVHQSKWEQWAMADPGNAKLLEEARELLLVLAPKLPGTEVAAEIAKFKQQFGDVYSAQEIKPRKKYLRGVFASVATAACIGFVSFLLWPASGKKTEPLAVTEHHAGFGERRQILLPDGSTVILNSNSQLTYNSDFNKKERRIVLSGEAFFKVVKDSEKKFIVFSEGFSTTAIGTAFYVHGRQPSQSYSVNLIEGKVSLQNESGSPFLLEAGEEAKWNKNVFDKNRFDTASLRQWIEGKLQFQRVETGEVLRHLSQWYAVEIEDQRKRPGAITITGDYSNKPLEDILKAICFSLSCRYTIYGNKIIIQ